MKLKIKIRFRIKDMWFGLYWVNLFGNCALFIGIIPCLPIVIYILTSPHK
jgi:hypothetical protein